MVRSGVILGSPRDHLGIVLAAFWGRFGVVFYTFGQFFLDLFWHRFELIFGLFGAGLTLLGGFGAFLCQELVIWEGLGQKME